MPTDKAFRVIFTYGGCRVYKAIYREERDAQLAANSWEHRGSDPRYLSAGRVGAGG